MFQTTEKIANILNKTGITGNINYNKYIFYFLLRLKRKFAPFKVNINTKCLILAQYPGAETKGAGGLIAQFPKNFEVLCITNGSNSMPGINPIETANIKNKQFGEVMQNSRIKGYKMFDIDDGTLKDNFATFMKIDVSEIDYVFVPNVYDNNIDTIYLLKFFKQLLREKDYKQNLKIIMYESDFPLCTLDYYVDISHIMETKKKMLRCYYPEDSYPNLAERMIGLNSFRGLSHGCDYCEAFMAFSVEEFLKIPLI